MEILKKLFVIALIFGAQLMNAQDQKTLQDAFNKSYDLEYLKQYNEAVDAMKAANAVSSYPAQIRLGWLLYSAKRYSEAVEAYKKAATLMPASIEALNGIVNSLAIQNKWEEVERTYQTILEKDPKNSTTHYRLGLIYYNKKQYVKAELHFNAALNMYPFDYYSMLYSGWNNYFLGKYAEAKKLFNMVLLYSPKDASAKEGLGLIK